MKKYWRSLDELAETEEYRKFLDDEFPSRSEEWLQPLNRREVLRLMGASFALAGVTACTTIGPEPSDPAARSSASIGTVAGTYTRISTFPPDFGVTRSTPPPSRPEGRSTNRVPIVALAGLAGATE